MNEELFIRSGLSLERLRTLCAVAESGSIAKAAEGDPVRQSQFSRQLRELGEFFEVDLTRRRGKGAELTEAGRELAAVGREVLDVLGDFRKSLSGGSKVLRIGAGESLIQWHVLPRMKVLQRELPQVVLSMRNLRGAAILTQIGEAQIDFGLTSAEELPAGLESAKLGEVRYRVFVTDKRAESKRGKDWESAMQLPLVGMEGEGSLMQRVRKIAVRQGIALKVAVYCSSLPAVAAALRELDGFAILPEAAEAKGLVGIDAPFLREFDRTIWLCWSSRRLAIRSEMVRWRRKLIAALEW